MRHQLRVVGIFAISFFISAVLAQAQSWNVLRQALVPAGGFSSEQPIGAASAFPGQASSSSYTFASSAKQDESNQQQGNGSQTQSQTGNQSQGMNGNQSQNPGQARNQNKQGQAKQEAPPEKPQYLTYTPKKKSLQEEVKLGKARPVEFKSVPPGAEITVDGYFLGKTPMTTQIPLGKHLVSITKWGYQSWEQELDVTKGSSPSVDPKLQKDW